MAIRLYNTNKLKVHQLFAICYLCLGLDPRHIKEISSNCTSFFLERIHNQITSINGREKLLYMQRAVNRLVEINNQHTGEGQ
ncbi:hypothetical protein NIES4074_24150 [Cylindrospermum sp. NIES-4074]|nr:hypothetical protein NIES4074_24150 [Cylindrospermum sp. NIES-4074]